MASSVRSFLAGCIIISMGSIWTADDGYRCTTESICIGRQRAYTGQPHHHEETLDVEAKSHVEMFHHFFFTLPPDDKYIHYTMNKAMYLVDETGLAQYNTLKEKGFTPTS